MKKAGCFIWVVVFAAVAAFAIAEESKEKVLEGMEMLEAGNTRLMLPKGMRYQKKGDLIVLETSEEYVARRLVEMDERLAKIEASQMALNEKVRQLERTLSQKQNNNLTSN